MTGAGKVVSKSYSCDMGPAERPNNLQVQSIGLLITNHDLDSSELPVYPQ